MKSRGLYLHIPFCAKKCSYCDFYSFASSEQQYDKYVTALCDEFLHYKERFSAFFDSLYFGGGTPSLLGGERIKKIIDCVKASLVSPCEITVECNPADNLLDTFKVLKQAGVNRISLGVQSAVEQELAVLGRRHTNNDVIRTVEDLRTVGINNISLDLMIGLPNQTFDSLKQSLDFLVSLEPKHISCYILKVEKGTELYKNYNQFSFPDDEIISDMYLFVCKYLKEQGFEHYEISNFAKPEYRSKHNMKYWNCEEYLGIGPSAHSFMDGERFYYKRSLNSFFNGESTVTDGDGGSEDEYIMLRLRLLDGLNFYEFKNRFGKQVPSSILSAALSLQKHGLVNISNEKISLTEKGFLVSNSVILKLLEK